MPAVERWGAATKAACSRPPTIWFPAEKQERAKGLEPSTPTLARLCSTPELRPPAPPRTGLGNEGGAYCRGPRPWQALQSARSAAEPWRLQAALVDVSLGRWTRLGGHLALEVVALPGLLDRRRIALAKAG